MFQKCLKHFSVHNFLNLSDFYMINVHFDIGISKNVNFLKFEVII